MGFLKTSKASAVPFIYLGQPRNESRLAISDYRERYK